MSGRPTQVRDGAHLGISRKDSITRQPPAAELSRAVVEVMALGIVVYDRHLRVVYINPHASRWFKSDVPLDQSLENVTGDTGTSESWELTLRTVIKDHRPVHLDDLPYQRGKRTGTWEMDLSPLPLKEAPLRLAIAVIRETTPMTDIRKGLLKTQRLATLGQMTAKVAHELNNPIDGILRYVNLASRALEDQGMDRPREYLARASEGLVQLAQLAGELLDRSRGPTGSTRYLTVNQLIREVLEGLLPKIQAADDTHVCLHCGPDVPKVRRDPLHQILCNLVKNAYEAMPKGGVLEISFSVDHEVLVVQVRDTGPGFESGYLRHACEPFRTTKTQGTGLGLAVCHDLVERCKGRMELGNAPDGGAHVLVRLQLKEIT